MQAVRGLSQRHAAPQRTCQGRCRRSTAVPRATAAAEQPSSPAPEAPKPQPAVPAAAAAATKPGPKQPMPLLDAVVQRGGRSSEVPLHVPGHKRGAAPPPGLDALMGGALRYDLTELAGLDVLSGASGPIAEAQAAAAATWGADASWLLVNGTTGGIHAAVLATCGPGDALILGRNAHLSAFNAMVLSGCTPVYARPCCDPSLGVAHHLTPAALRDAFSEAASRGLGVGAALVVSPTYFGVVSDVPGLAAVCQEHGVPLIVDEAHGAHLGLHPSLPRSALQGGADVSVQSTHKQLSALTQAAMLHVRGGRVAHERVARALQTLQSSSPSYLLMASLDAARAQAADPHAHQEGLVAAAFARRHLTRLPGVRLLSAAQAAACDGASSAASAAAAGVALDPLRLTLDLQQLGLSGYQAAEALEQRHGVVSELATPSCVVLAMGIGSTLQHAQALVAAVEQLCKQHGGSSSSDSAAPAAAAAPAPAPAPQVRLSPRDAFFAAAEAVPAEQAAGRVSAELLCPYPPGVPAAYPGEALTPAILEQLRAVQAAGGTITGCSDPSLRTVRVIVGA